MDAIHKIVSRRLIDRSQKRHSKRLVAEENCKDDDETAYDEWNVYSSSFNPNFEMLSCEVQCNTDSSGSNSLSTEEAMTPSPQGSASGDEYPTRKLSTGELSGADISKTVRERTLYKVSSAVRKKFSLANPFCNNQKNVNRNLNADSEKIDDCDKERWSGAQGEIKESAKDKPKRKKIDIMDVRILGRRQGNENQQLLKDEVDEE
ncbi:hypothetical protein Tcan_16510 [Toxocara canis]|uniref:Uncharacterized protein n=1 Tax=Toxocara canis TaxID=6265 RepID=A0A0B2VM87_TOXCA|nr:hypothetical protein Tcan_16510 [Toxocara canis]